MMRLSAHSFPSIVLRSLVLVGALFARGTTAHSEDPMTGWPPDLKAVYDPQNPDPVWDLIDARYRAHLGEPFPNVSVDNGRGLSKSIASYRGKPLLLLYAGGPCPRTLELLDKFRADGWKVPGHELVITLKYLPMANMRKYLKGFDEVFQFTEFPPAGFLQYMHVYPEVFEIDEHGTFISYQLGVRAKVSIPASQPQKGDP